MKFSELKSKYHEIIVLLHNKQLKDAFDKIKVLLDSCLNQDLKNQFDTYYSTYQNMLKYTFELGDDPEKEKVYFKLVKSVFEITDDIKEDIIIRYKLLSYSVNKHELIQRKQLTKDDSAELIDSLEFEREFQKILSETNKQKASSEKDNKSYKLNLSGIFKIIWLTDKFKEAETELVGMVCKTKNLPWYDKCILVSSLTLSLLRHFDAQKINLLFDFYETGENQVWQRALIGLIIGMYYFDGRLKFYPEIVDRLRTYRGEKSIERTIELVIIQFLRAKETEEITKKIRDEILPEVMKMKSLLEEKLDLENIISSKMLDDKNPDWENFFKDSPDMYNKFEELTNLQMEGADVFMSAFALLKRFSFFDELTSWFLPFYKENEDAIQSLEDIKNSIDIQQFVEGLERTTFLCNSDKYSFCLNVKHLPIMQKSMMTELFNMELKAMNEMAESDDLINASSKNKSVITQYFQDLYRFHKLHPNKSEFEDIFEQKFDIYNSYFYNILVENQQIKRNIGEYFFEKNHFKEAIDLFLQLTASLNDAELFEKIAYSFQKTGNLEKALEYYHKAEFLESKNPWLIKKIAFCYRKSGKFREAIEYYLSCEKIEPENLQILASIGHTYMEMEEYEKALKYYFKAEYLEPDNLKIQRPVSWCSFLLNKLENAKKYLLKVIKKEGNKNDYINMGHIDWCLGKRKEATESYTQSIKKSNYNFEWFTKVMNEDKRYLVQKGIHDFDIPLIIDYLKMIIRP